MITINNKMLTKKENIVARKIHDTFFLIDISDNYSDDKCVLYEINETGKFIWDCIDGNSSIDQIAVLLKKAITDDVDYQMIYNDVTEYIGVLKIKDFVREEA